MIRSIGVLIELYSRFYYTAITHQNSFCAYFCTNFTDGDDVNNSRERERETDRQKKKSKTVQRRLWRLDGIFRFQQHLNIRISDTTRLIKIFNLFRRSVVSLLHVCLALVRTHFDSVFHFVFFLIFAFDMMTTLFHFSLLSAKSLKSRLFLFSGGLCR